jgi:hypothetical protein
MPDSCTVLHDNTKAFVKVSVRLDISCNIYRYYIWKDLQITWSLQRKQNKNKIKLTESLKGNNVEKNYTRLWIVNYSRNNIK